MSAGKLLPAFWMEGVLVFSGSPNKKMKTVFQNILQDCQNWDSPCHNPTSALRARRMLEVLIFLCCVYVRALAFVIA